MDRRNIFRSAFAVFTGAFAARAAAPASAQDSNIAGVAYHLSDLDKVAFVLGNIRNHLDGVGGPDKVRIAVIVHGPALRAFHKAGAFHDISSRTAGFVGDGVRFEACHHTMAGQKVTLDDLMPGFVVAERGGVVRLAQLQREGWAYLRP